MIVLRFFHANLVYLFILQLPSVADGASYQWKIESVFDDCFPPRHKPRLGTSLIELCLPLTCDCSNYVFDKIFRCLSPLDLSSTNAGCLLIDCGGQFSVAKFVQFSKDKVRQESTHDSITYSASTLEEVNILIVWLLSVVSDPIQTTYHSCFH